MSTTTKAKLKEQVFQFLSNAFKYANQNGISKTVLSKWLHTQNIAIKEMKFDKKTFTPHITIEFLDKDTGTLHEFTYKLTLIEGKSTEEIMKDIEQAMAKKVEEKNAKIAN
jgi:Zn-dependent oligopeptidase